MPRKPRFFLPDVPNHVVQRGRSREPVFFEPADYLFYLEKLRDETKESDSFVYFRIKDELDIS